MLERAPPLADADRPAQDAAQVRGEGGIAAAVGVLADQVSDIAQDMREAALPGSAEVLLAGTAALCRQPHLG